MSLLQSFALRLRLHERCRLNSKLLSKIALQLLGSLLRLTQHPTPDLQGLRRCFLAMNALPTLPGEGALGLLVGLPGAIDFLKHPPLLRGVSIDRATQVLVADGECRRMVVPQSFRNALCIDQQSIESRHFLGIHLALPQSF